MIDMLDAIPTQKNLRKNVDWFSHIKCIRKAKQVCMSLDFGRTKRHLDRRSTCFLAFPAKGSSCQSDSMKANMQLVSSFNEWSYFVIEKLFLPWKRIRLDNLCLNKNGLAWILNWHLKNSSVLAAVCHSQSLFGTGGKNARDFLPRERKEELINEEFCHFTFFFRFDGWKSGSRVSVWSVQVISGEERGKSRCLRLYFTACIDTWTAGQTGQRSGFSTSR